MNFIDDVLKPIKIESISLDNMSEELFAIYIWKLLKQEKKNILLVTPTLLEANKLFQKIILYTDGACSGNPGPGGWGSILILGDNKKEISGGSPATTNNIMELTAVIEGLKILKRPCKVQVYSDSAYVVNGFIQKWIYGWMKKNWKNASGEPVKNKELWQELYNLTQIHDVTFHKVKGHADNELNNRCDELARMERDKF